MRTQGYRKPNDKPTYMNTLTACSNKMVKDGYTDNFKVKKQGLFSIATEKHYSPADTNVINYYRFEGQSDPGDNIIMYVIETTDGQKGLLIDAYGPYADETVSKFMQEVEDIHKKTDESEKAKNTDE